MKTSSKKILLVLQNWKKTNFNVQKLIPKDRNKNLVIDQKIKYRHMNHPQKPSRPPCQTFIQFDMKSPTLPRGIP